MVKVRSVSILNDVFWGFAPRFDADTFFSLRSIHRAGTARPDFARVLHSVFGLAFQVVEVCVTVADLDISRVKRSAFLDQSKLQRAARRVTASFGPGYVDASELRGSWFVTLTVHGFVDGPLPPPSRNAPTKRTHFPLHLPPCCPPSPIVIARQVGKLRGVSPCLGSCWGRAVGRHCELLPTALGS